MTEKPFDKAIKEIQKHFENEAQAQNKMKPLLDDQLKRIKKVDDKILWFEKKIKEEEANKEILLKKMNELLDMANQVKHSLPDGFTVLPDDKREFEVEDAGKFLKWLKLNKSPSDVMEFFKTSLKKTALRSFCNSEANEQRTKGIINPEIDGIILGDTTYTRLTTKRK